MAKTSPSYPLYHETLGAAQDAAIAYFQALGAVFNPDVLTDSLFRAFSGGVSYGNTVSGSIEIESLKGNKTKKWAHLSLYRMDCGKYELTAYML